MLKVSLDHAIVDVAVAVYGVAGLADTLVGESRIVNLWLGLGLGLGLRLFLPALSASNLVTALIENITISINGLALELLLITLNNGTDALALVHRGTLVANDRIGEVSKGTIFLDVLEFRVRNRLGLANNLSGVVEDLVFIADLVADEVLQDTLDDMALDGAPCHRRRRRTC